MSTREQARTLKFGANLRSRISDIEAKGYIINRKLTPIKGGYIAEYRLAEQFLNGGE